LGIEHRLTQPRTPQTNGMVVRFSSRINDIPNTHRFQSGEDVMESLHRYAVVYDHQLSLAAPDSKTPVQVMKESFKFNPELFSQGLMIGRDVTLGRLLKKRSEDGRMQGARSTATGYPSNSWARERAPRDTADSPPQKFTEVIRRPASSPINSKSNEEKAATQ